MNKHHTILGSLSVAIGLCGIVGIPFVSVSLVVGGIVSGEWPVILLTSSLAVAIVLVLLAFSIPNIVAGVGLLQGRRWSRRAIVVASILNILNVPFGPLLGAYGLWTVVHED